MLATGNSSFSQQGLDLLARLSEDALRAAMVDRPSPEFSSNRQRVVLLRSRLSRYRKLFEGGLIGESEYFGELRKCEAELGGIIASVAGADDRELSGLRSGLQDAVLRARELPAYKVFISYRRDDSAYVSDRIADHLARCLGTEAVFRDTQSIELGDDFALRIDEALARTRVCLVVIGQRWRGRLAGGGSRIDQLDDFVRREVAAALGRRITTVPVLVEGLRLDEMSDLPAELAGIRARNALTLRPDPHFRTDMERLTSFVLRRLS